MGFESAPRTGLRPVRPPWGVRELGAALRFLMRMSGPTGRGATCAAAACVRGLLLAAWLGVLGHTAGVRAQGIELPQLSLSRQEGGLTLDFEVKLALSRATEDALQRGVPLYFTASAQVFHPRWYWRDERVARATRTWRISYQPLTSSWRVSFGALSQNYPSAEAALAMISRATRWRIAEPEQIDPSERYYVEFSYRLDSSMLPRPLQLDLAVQSDWRLSVERTLKLD